MSFFSRMGAALQNFFRGRYGTDTLNRHLTVFWLILAGINLAFHSTLLSVLELLLAFVIFFRMLSRNFTKRQKENHTYYQFTRKISLFFRGLALRIKERKTTRFFSCPYCKAKIKMPKKIGRFKIRCQKCGETFIKEFDK